MSLSAANETSASGLSISAAAVLRAGSPRCRRQTDAISVSRRASTSGGGNRETSNLSGIPLLPDADRCEAIERGIENRGGTLRIDAA